MKAIAYASYGAPLSLVELPEPKLAQNSVLVRVVAAGVNNADLVLHAGLGAPIMDAWFPVVPGWDVAGVVEAVGAGVTEFRPGDEVIGYVRDEILHHGAYAEKVAAPVEAFAVKPSTLSWTEAAALPLAALTAYRAIVHVLAVKAGERLLVHGAAGGVGAIATQLALARGARVLGHDRAERRDELTALGAEPVAADDWPVVDAVLDCAGRGLLARTLGAQPGVRACGIVEPARGAVMVFGRRDARVLAEVAAVTKPRVGRVVPLADASEAHRAFRAGEVTGKIVLAIAPSAG